MRDIFRTLGDKDIVGQILPFQGKTGLVSRLISPKYSKSMWCRVRHLKHSHKVNDRCVCLTKLSFLEPFVCYISSYVPFHLPFPLFGRNIKKDIKVSASESCFFLNLRQIRKETQYTCMWESRTEPMKGLKLYPTCKLAS